MSFLKILLVDPDGAWLSKAKNYLINQMYEVVDANSGRDAQLALYNHKFFAVLLNYDIQNHPCIEVLKFIRTNYPNQRVILILDSKDPIDKGEISEEKLSKMGIAEILIRPFELTHIKDTLEGYKTLKELLAGMVKNDGVSEEQEVQMDDLNFSSINIDEFYSSQSVFFDIYIKIKANKYLKILHMGDNFSKERVDKYKNERQVHFLYFHNSDRRRFIEYNKFVVKKMIESKTISGDKKISQLKNVSEKFIDEAYTVGVKSQVVEQGKEVCENVYNLVQNQPDLHLVLRRLEDFDPSALAHSFLVTLYSAAIIRQFEWQSETTIQTAAMACMFHDIGRTLLPKEFINLRPKDMTPEQLELFKTHPELGVKAVENCRELSAPIKQIIIQHHEAYDGTGYPYKKKGIKIFALANIICLVDDFVHIMIDEKLQPTDALCKILTDKEAAKRYNSMSLEKFIHVFADPKKIRKDAGLPSLDGRVVGNRRI